MPSKTFLALATAALLGTAMISTGAYAANPKTTDARQDQKEHQKDIRKDAKADQKDINKNRKDVHHDARDPRSDGGAFTR